MGKRILILDNDRDLLEILQEILVYEGFKPVMVEATDDLFNIVRQYQPALILLDYALNGLNGGAWCSQLKSDPELICIPVILFSAYSNKGFKKGSFGCDDFIAKPFDLYDLVQRIRALTSGKPRFDTEQAVPRPVPDVSTFE